MFKNEEKKAVTEMVNSSNVIAKETKIIGEIAAQGNIRIEGTVEGTIKSEKKVVIGESAKIIGNITALDIEISGFVQGEVSSSEALYLKKTAVINGDMYTKKLVVENGAVFNGICKMTDDETSPSEMDTVEDHMDKQLVK
ncbi:bactofilin family protein [Anditalea andensis]|uniref:Cell shape determination protein CcmA n=1 Tax=Anditalea andensis TaxID=1048983 RepID=A0A074KSY2_9BACT|nr:polymer-forming cytoskeletal protein [Anditalea andensis]KEO73066.1 cell shape determination protein CcmA [Anditalea andensis]